MRRLWLVWLWSRLTRQHKMSWWEVRRLLRDATQRERAEDAIRREIARRVHTIAARSGP